MTPQARFWRFVADAARCDRDCRAAHDRIGRQFSSTRVQLLHLERALAGQQARTVHAFHDVLVEVHRAAYRRDLWTAFELSTGSLTSIEFAEAIGWLVLQGEQVHRMVLDEPDLLAETEPEPADLRDGSGIEEVARAALSAPPPAEEPVADFLAELDAADAALPLIGYPAEPPGAALPADLATLRRRFPRHIARYHPGEHAVLPTTLHSLVGG